MRINLLSKTIKRMIELMYRFTIFISVVLCTVLILASCSSVRSLKSNSITANRVVSEYLLTLGKCYDAITLWPHFGKYPFRWISYIEFENSAEIIIAIYQDSVNISEFPKNIDRKYHKYIHWIKMNITDRSSICVLDAGEELFVLASDDSI